MRSFSPQINLNKNSFRYFSFNNLNNTNNFTLKLNEKPNNDKFSEIKINENKINQLLRTIPKHKKEKNIINKMKIGNIIFSGLSKRKKNFLENENEKVDVNIYLLNCLKSLNEKSERIMPPNSIE